MWHIHLQVSQISNQKPSMVLWQQFLIVKDRKGLSKSLKEQKVAPDETLLSFDVSMLFTSIPAPVALEAINRKFTAHINQAGIWKIFWNIVPSYPKTKVFLFWN